MQTLHEKQERITPSCIAEEIAAERRREALDVIDRLILQKPPTADAFQELLSPFSELAKSQNGDGQAPAEPILDVAPQVLIIESEPEAASPAPDDDPDLRSLIEAWPMLSPSAAPGSISHRYRQTARGAAPRLIFLVRPWTALYPTRMRWIVGDIHGMLTPLTGLVNAVSDVDPDPQWLFVGDYVNRGPDSKGVIEFLINLPNARYCRGNHDDIFDLILNGQCFVEQLGHNNRLGAYKWFMEHGLADTLASYGAEQAAMQAGCWLSQAIPV